MLLDALLALFTNLVNLLIKPHFRCKKVPKRRCYLKMIIDCPKKKSCKTVEEEECEDVPVKKCKNFKVI